MIFYWFAMQVVIILLKVNNIVSWEWVVIFIPSIIIIICQLYIYTMGALSLGFIQAVRVVLENDYIIGESHEEENNN